MRTKVQDQSPDIQVPLATLQELVAQYHHRLLSLEADLKDQAKAGSLAPRAFARRVKQLKKVHERLAELQQVSAAEDGGKLTSADIGLPLLDECTPEGRPSGVRRISRLVRGVPAITRFSSGGRTDWMP